MEGDTVETDQETERQPGLDGGGDDGDAADLILILSES